MNKFLRRCAAFHRDSAWRTKYTRLVGAPLLAAPPSDDMWNCVNEGHVPNLCTRRTVRSYAHHALHTDLQGTRTTNSTRPHRPAGHPKEPTYRRAAVGPGASTNQITCFRRPPSMACIHTTRVDPHSASAPRPRHATVSSEVRTPRRRAALAGGRVGRSETSDETSGSQCEGGADTGLQVKPATFQASVMKSL